MMRMIGLLAAVVSLGLTAASATAPATALPTRTTSTTASTNRVAHATVAAPTLVVGRSAWIAVSVATLWRSPSSPRAVDAPALANPARIRQWLGDMTLAQRRGLSGRADTQALLGDSVRVVRLGATWARIVVPSQPSPLDSRGYPGWVPRRQLTARRPASTRQVATVVTRTAWLLTDRAVPQRIFPISFGTTLPVVATTRTFVRVASPTGAVRRLARSVVVVHAAGTPARQPSRASLVSTAKTFLGLPYLWAGASGFGLDCSGLTWLVYRAHGIVIPRDAAPQARHGTAVAALRPGDLMFYASGGVVHHVSMYVGGSQMIHAPGTGQRVVVVSTSTLRSEYVGARRYLR